MEKHKNIPAAATWDEKGYWKLGEKNEAGKEIGIWNAWRPEGHLRWTVNFGDGNPPFLYTAFHIDGTISQEGNWYGGNKWLGTYRWTKSDNPTTEHFPGNGGDKSPNVWVAEFDYVEEGIYNAQRYYDKQHNPVNVNGEPLPERPATVGERAHHKNSITANHGKACWVMGQVDNRINKFVGDYTEWYLNGNLLVTRVYDRTTGEVVEQHEYEKGQLKQSKVYTSGEILQSFYHRGTNPPVINKNILYRNNEKDRTQAFFDETGNRLYAVRHEKVSDLHERRYYNDSLVYEGIKEAEITKAPVSIRYFYPNGTTLIDYTSNGDGTGLLRLYNEAAQELLNLTVSAEESCNKYKYWDTFMPSWSSYNGAETVVPDWVAVTEIFKQKHEDELWDEKLHALAIPAHLQTELDKVEWDEIETAMEECQELPVFINGMLSEEDAIANTCLDTIWNEIEHQNSVYEATYKITAILARMLPHYAHVPVVQQRLEKFYFEVLGLAHIRSYEELYEELVASFQPSLPVVLKWAGDAHVTTALRAQYILTHIGKNDPDVEVLLKNERDRTDRERFRRGYAIFSLGSMYLYSDRRDKLITEFTPLFENEPDEFIRLALAVYLVGAAGPAAQDNWLAELIRTLTNSEEVERDFKTMQPFIRSYGVQDFVLMVLNLNNVNREVLEKNIEPIIDMLTTANAFKQETLFQTIFSILFRSELALVEITPVRKKALLAAAEVVAERAGYVNFMEIFREYKLPYDAYELKQLAAKSN